MKFQITLLIAAMVLFAVSNSAAQESDEDILFLNNGSVIRGEIVEQKSHDCVGIQTQDGSLFVYSTEDVKMILNGNQVETYSDPGNDEVKTASTQNDSYDLAHVGGTVSPVNVVPQHEVDFGIKVGYFAPNEESVKDIYGGGVTVEGELIIWNRTGFGTAFGFQRYSKSGDPYVYDPNGYVTSASADISIMPFTFTGLYRMTKNSPQTKIRPYFGAGVGIYVVKEKLSASFSDGDHESDSASLHKMGFHFLGGIQADLWKHASLVFDIKYASASLSLRPDMIDNDVDLGGFSVSSGVRF